MRWPRKNDQGSIDARRSLMGVGDGLTTSVDLAPFAAAAESLVGVAVIPVSAAPIEVELGSYELSDEGEPIETGRATETVRVPLAHTEGGLTASMTRGALAAGPIRTFVLHDRITRASCFVCRDAAEAVALARWIDRRAPGDAGVARCCRRPVAVEARAPPRGEDPRRRRDVPRALAPGRRATRSART